MGQTEQRESELLTLLIRIANIESHVEHYREIDVENLPDPASYQKTLLDLESQLSQLDQQGREAIRELSTLHHDTDEELGGLPSALFEDAARTARRLESEPA